MSGAAEPWSARAELYRTSTAHSQGPDLELVVEWAEGLQTAIDVATGGGHVARRLRDAGLQVVSCDPAPGMRPDVICFAEELPVRRALVRPRRHPRRGSSLQRTCRRRRASSVASRDRGSSSSTRSTAGEDMEEAEKLRDPSHVRNYSEAEWRGFFETAGIEVEEVRIFSYPIELEPWLERTECTGADAERARALLADRVTDGNVTFERIALRGKPA